MRNGHNIRKLNKLDWRNLADMLCAASNDQIKDPVVRRIFDLAREAALKCSSE